MNACPLLLVIGILGGDAMATEASLGRLFHTAAERAQLDALSANGSNQTDLPATPLVNNGTIRRGATGRIVLHWLNGQIQAPGSSPASTPMPTPGDSLDPTTGARLPLLGTGVLQIRPYLTP
jgi:hypothetical protein